MKTGVYAREVRGPENEKAGKRKRRDAWTKGLKEKESQMKIETETS